jgi:hypothetical protein
MTRSSQSSRGRASKRGRGLQKLQPSEDECSEGDDNGGIEILNAAKKKKQMMI